MDKEETPLEDILDHDANPESASDPDIVEETAPEPEEVKEPEPKEGPKDAPMVPLAALHEVRDANKSIKAELEAIKAASQPAEPEPTPDPVLEPEKYADWQAEQTHKVTQTLDTKLYEQKLGMSRFQFAQQHGEESVQELVDWFGQQPLHVQQEAQQHPHPFAYAHELKQTADLTQKFSDPAMREKFEAFLAGDQTPSPKPKAPSPKPKAPATTAGARNVSDRSGPAWSGPTPLEQILPD